jgi:prepilin-type N-terminal cleavage/methylation domain-containing protein
MIYTSNSNEGQRTMKLNLTNRSRGLTLTELLVVMLILGLLATIAIPVYTRRQEDARIRVAISECREIAHAEEQVAVLHGFYVPFQLLDDLPPPPFNTTDPNRESLDNDNQSLLLIDPFVRATDQISGNPQQAALRQWQTDFDTRVYNMVRNWNGPFINFQRFYYGNDPNVTPGTQSYLSSTIKFEDYPLDPWGNPYRFYSAEGIIGTSALTWDPGANTQSFSDGNLTTTDRRFDRYAVVSFGRDGKSDTVAPVNVNNPNDIFYLFGSDGVESTFGRNF